MVWLRAYSSGLCPSELVSVGAPSVSTSNIRSARVRSENSPLANRIACPVGVSPVET